MATVVNKRLYRIEFLNGGSQCQDVVADNLIVLAQQVENPNTPVSKVFMVNPSVTTVETDVPNPVAFAVVVSPDTTFGSATPTAFTVEAGSSVIFQAVPATGHTFVGWQINGITVSTALITQLTIPAPAISGQTVQVTALFA